MVRILTPNFSASVVDVRILLDCNRVKIAVSLEILLVSLFIIG
jgi:hypothetical protein